MRRRELFTILGGAVAALSASPRPGLAQARYPERPIRLVIPFPPGGAFDAIGRGWADGMKNRLGSVVVENIGGGGSSLGTAAVARAQPDGYTILLGGAGALVINPLISRTAYDPIRDFAPIAPVAVHSFAIVVNPSLPVRTLAELVAHARQIPPSCRTVRPASDRSIISPLSCSSCAPVPWTSSTSPTGARDPPSRISSAGRSGWLCRR